MEELIYETNIYSLDGNYIDSNNLSRVFLKNYDSTLKK